MKLTRRELAAAAVAPAALQNGSGREKELEAARETARRHGGALDKFPLPMETEPAVQFRA